MNFKGKKIVIFGLGILGGGAGSAEFFAKRGAKVLITDLKKEKELKPSLDKLKKYKIKYVLGRHRSIDLLNADLIIKNPGVSSSSPFLKTAQKNKIPIETAESLFLKLSPARDIVGVTGTRGKSTVSALIYGIFKKSGFDAHLAGNFKGTSTLELLNKVKKDSQIILELSSWQLESFGWHKISPHVAVVTNIYPDHLNRYSSVDDYIKDKKNIFKFQKESDYLILNHESDYCQSFAKEARSRVLLFSKNDIEKSLRTKLQGEHNLENMAAALAVGRIYNIKEKIIKEVFSSFSTLPFRLQKIGKIKGVRIINDSTSTTPTALIKALNSFPDKNIILIAGGNGKNLPVDEMIDKIKNRCKAAILLKGDGTNQIIKKLEKGWNKVYGIFDSLDFSLRKALSLSSKDDIILFSPGFTSFSMFKNEFERGEKFNHAFKTLLKKEKNK